MAKKRALQPSTLRCCSHSPGNTVAWQVPLPIALGGGQKVSLPKTLQLGATGAAPSMWFKWDRMLLVWSAGCSGKPQQVFLIPEVGVAHCHWKYRNQNHLQPPSPKGHHGGGHCDQTPPVGALAPAGTHLPATATAKGFRQYLWQYKPDLCHFPESCN